MRKVFLLFFRQIAKWAFAGSARFGTPGSALGPAQLAKEKGRIRPKLTERGCVLRGLFMLCDAISLTTHF